LKKNTLLMLSGGIDSTATLLWMLDNTDDNIEVHHINLINRTNRYKSEKIAVYNILNWFEINKRKFEYTESTIDLGMNGWIPYDRLIYTFIGGCKVMGINKTNKLDRFVGGDIKLYNNSESSQSFRKYNRKKCKELLDMVSGFRYDRYTENSPNFTENGGVYYTPLKNWTKEEVIAYLPEDLLSLCWYCRTPLTGHGKCGTCVSCMAVKRATGQLTLEEIKQYKRWID